MADYYRVSPRFWRSRAEWSDQDRLFALYLLSCPHRNLEGLFYLPKGYIQTDLGWSLQAINKSLAHLREERFAFYDEQSKVLLLRKALKYQTPDGRNHIIGAMNALAKVPPNDLWEQFLDCCKQWAPNLYKELVKRCDEDKAFMSTPSETPSKDLRKTFETPSKPIRNTSEHSNSNSNSNSLTPLSDSSDVVMVFEAWKESAGKTSRTEFSEKRKRLIRNALKSYPLEDVLDAVEGWKHSPHHRGENSHGTVYNNIELLLRDAEHIEKFRDLNRSGKTVPTNDEFKERLRRLSQ